MVWYIKKEEFFHSELLGPFDSREQAERQKLKDITNGRPESHIRYRIFESQELF